MALLLLGLAAGLYLPSGVATVTSLVTPQNWGKALAVHELAPNIGFLSAPLLAELLLSRCSWREILYIVGACSIAAGILFAVFGKGGSFPGEAPSRRTMKLLTSQPSFWIMVFFFSLGIGASLGIYTILPLFLVSERGMERGFANALLGLSRLSGPFVAIAGGWMTDRLGPKRWLVMVFLSTGLLTVLLGGVSGSVIVLFIFIQPLMAAAYFPAGFASLAKVGPPEVRNVAVSFTSPAAFLIGGGVVPALLGIAGEMGSFATGITAFGVIILGGTFLVRYLRFWEGTEKAPLRS